MKPSAAREPKRISDFFQPLEWEMNKSERVRMAAGLANQPLLLSLLRFPSPSPQARTHLPTWRADPQRKQKKG